MDYMDQSVSCRVCGKETSSIITKICLSCERAEKEAARKAEWDSKSDLEKCFSYLESWANPSHATFSSQTAAFVLNTFRAALSQQEDGELPPLPQSKTYASL
jgi:ribosomal protein L37E